MVILDDVWSLENLEKWLFEGVGYKTLVTSRDHSTIPKMNSIHLYELPLLDDGDALPLSFMNLHCWMMVMLYPFSAFGQKSIPSTTKVDSFVRIFLDLNVRNDGDALSLFCFWDFRQKSIPSTTNRLTLILWLGDCQMNAPMYLEFYIVNLTLKYGREFENLDKYISPFSKYD